jgi:hypothetical protein
MLTILRDVPEVQCTSGDTQERKHDSQEYDPFLRGDCWDMEDTDSESGESEDEDEDEGGDEDEDESVDDADSRVSGEDTENVSHEEEELEELECTHDSSELDED